MEIAVNPAYDPSKTVKAPNGDDRPEIEVPSVRAIEPYVAVAYLEWSLHERVNRLLKKCDEHGKRQKYVGQ